MKKERIKLGTILIIALFLSFLLQYKLNNIDGELHFLRFQQSAVISTLKIMAHCVQQYYNTNKKYPTKLSKNDFVQYGLKNIDPWGNRYIYETNGTMFNLLSIGPDRVKNTKDDMGIQQEISNVEWENKIKINSSYSKKIMKMSQLYLISIVTLFVFTIWIGWSFIFTFKLRLRWQILMIIGIIIIFSLSGAFFPRW